LDIEEGTAGVIFAAGVDAGHHDAAFQTFPEVFDQPFDFACELGEEAIGIGGADGDVDVGAFLFEVGASVVVVVEDKSALPVDAVVIVFASEGVFVQADDELVEQAFGSGELSSIVYDAADLGLLAIAGFGVIRPCLGEVLGAVVGDELGDEAGLFVLVWGEIEFDFVGNVEAFHPVEEDGVDFLGVACFVGEGWGAPDVAEVGEVGEAVTIAGFLVVKYEADGFGEPVGFEDDVLVEQVGLVFVVVDEVAEAVGDAEEEFGLVFGDALVGADFQDFWVGEVGLVVVLQDFAGAVPCGGDGLTHFGEGGGDRGDRGFQFSDAGGGVGGGVGFAIDVVEAKDGVAAEFVEE
jgi:hypothetical protein